MSETTEELVAALGMDEDEQALADGFYAAIQAMTNKSERSQQSKGFQIGVSDLGFCSERVRRMLDQQVPEDTDMTLAWIGTALGDHLEQAALKRWPHMIRQATVSLDLPGELRNYTVTGHPDLIDPVEGVLIDGKTDYGLTTISRSGPTRSQRFQRMLYAKGAWQGGFFPNHDLDQIRVANVWIDRAGIDKHPHVQMEPYDEQVVRDAAEWLDDVVYAYLNEEEARKEPPREMCAVVCGFYEVCRAYDTDVQGLIRDEEALTAVALYREGMDLEKQGKKLKDEAKQHLVHINGSTGEFTVRWTYVNETEIPATIRRGYERLDIKPIPKGKVKR